MALFSNTRACQMGACWGWSSYMGIAMHCTDSVCTLSSNRTTIRNIFKPHPARDCLNHWCCLFLIWMMADAAEVSNTGPVVFTFIGSLVINVRLPLKLCATIIRQASLRSSTSSVSPGGGIHLGPDRSRKGPHRCLWRFKLPGLISYDYCLLLVAAQATEFHFL